MMLMLTILMMLVILKMPMMLMMLMMLMQFMVVRLAADGNADYGAEGEEEVYDTAAPRIEGEAE